MQLSLRTFTQTLSAMAASAQASCSTALNFTTGSVWLALFEGIAGLALWLQNVAFQVLQATRLATSAGSDCDSFGADYGFTRLPASAASGMVTFSRFVPTNTATIPVGTIVKTTDGTESFTVTASSTTTGFVADPAGATAGSYVIPAGTASLSVPVQAVTAGTGGNVLANTIGLVSSPLVGVDTVTNAAAFTNGINAESDAAFRARFALWLPSLARATPVAVESAALGVQQGIMVQLLENVATIGGATTPGSCVVAVDDGTGATPSNTIANIASAIEPFRPIGAALYTVQADVTTANISLGVTSSDPSAAGTVQAAVQAAITAYVNALPIGAGLPFNRLAQLAFDADSRVSNVTGLSLNGGTSDISGVPGYVVRSGTVTVS